MGIKCVRFNKNRFDSEDIEAFCKIKGFIIDKNYMNNDFYPSYMKDQEIRFIINKYIYRG